MADENIDKQRRLARQHIETAKLLGVDFVPVNAADESAAFPSNGETLQAQTTSAATAILLRGAKALQTLPKLNLDEKIQALQELSKRHDETCSHCTVATAHTQTVFGEGNPDANLMFIGEAPGENEDKTGRPFVGRAGKKLDEIICAMGYERKDIYIANVLKSRPPENRTPLSSEVEQCAQYLAEQIRIIRPKALVGLGGPASKWLLRTNIGVTRLRGQWAAYEDGTLQFPVMPTFHPAYLLRNYTPDTRKKVWSDMQQVMKFLEQSCS
ncbi:MAG: uracil-DNA glycosylase [Planctomycetes bacterium]|nr:uracil-DNA glycosylase [Planctomycetota bacterium]